MAGCTCTWPGGVVKVLRSGHGGCPPGPEGDGFCKRTGHGAETANEDGQIIPTWMCTVHKMGDRGHHLAPNPPSSVRLLIIFTSGPLMSSDLFYREISHSETQGDG